jgi:hypothetical protein
VEVRVVAGRFLVVKQLGAPNWLKKSMLSYCHVRGLKLQPSKGTISFDATKNKNWRLTKRHSVAWVVHSPL